MKEKKNGKSILLFKESIKHATTTQYSYPPCADCTRMDSHTDEGDAALQAVPGQRNGSVHVVQRGGNQLGRMLHRRQGFLDNNSRETAQWERLSKSHGQK